MDRTIRILDTEYCILDTKEKITIEDSFVKHNKIGSAHGEAKLYIGQESEELRAFWGDKGFEIECIVLKKDLLQYLTDTQVEYNNPEQDYINKTDLPQLWYEQKTRVENLENVVIFNLKDQYALKPPRVYVNTFMPVDKKKYDVIRELSLPNITYVSVLKLENLSNKKVIFYFKLFVDYFGSPVHPKDIQNENEIITLIDKDTTIVSLDKMILTTSRIGQGEYRKKLYENCPRCPITLISDDRILIASHIKPWVESNNKEKVDPYNGFMFTPTYDYLFDRGFMSFTDEKRIMLSPWLSSMTYLKLGLSNNKFLKELSLEKREAYMEYHRQNIFKG